VFNGEEVYPRSLPSRAS